ncbi:YrbL family protein [Aliarcobacter butzleri]|uniref:YrbL family protein n=2 Tax=Aliarcobacter butzleri TaxID=28197 RepID=UPI0018A0D271|nr:YrbL family protein [Aliarcobacter butzleri]MCT7645982.1 PhoP regulatory network YrbL family protein [Aliarcobacter butzleri]MDK2083238.1 YrbL family protein [Aliarcobacter butzleri]MDN5128278.1 YrbL family protein [Aliarcobacter butzleri]
MIIELREKFLIGEGGERLVYVHPNDSKKVIKILKPNLNKHNFQNDLEFKYYSFLIKKNKDFSNITKCFGYIDTNLGKGLVFERVIDYDGKDSKYFKYYLKKHFFTEDQEKSLLNNLKNFLENNQILFIDCNTQNVFCKKISEDKYTLIIYDGLGSRRDNMKLSLYMKSKLYTKYKIKKQWKLFLRNCEKAKNSVLKRY